MSTQIKEGNLHDIKCQSIHWNLLELLTLSKDPLASSGFVRELEETARCDDKFDLSNLRRSYRTKIGEETMSRVTNFEQTPQDEDRCKQAVLRYHYYTRSLLTDCLPVRDKTWFFLRTYVGEVTAAVAALGLSVPIYRGLRGMVSKSAEHQKNYMIPGD